MKGQRELKAILEVRNWKKAVAKETSKLKGKALLDYYNESTAQYRRKRAA